MSDELVVTEEEVKADLNDRRTFIGGSDAPVIIGLSGWKSPYELYLEKTGQAPLPDLSEVERVQWGVLLEDVVAKEFARRQGVKIQRVNQRQVSRKYPWMVAQIDRRIVGGGILEVKTTDISQSPQWGDEATEEIPPTYYTQVQHQLMVTGQEFAKVAVLIGGNRMRSYTIKRNEEFVDALEKAEIKFWQQVQTMTPPDPITPDEAALRWSRTKEAPVEGTPLHGALAAEYVGLSEQIKDLEGKQDSIKLELQKVLQDLGDTLMVNGRAVVSWKNQVSNRLDTAALKVDLPDIAAKYTKPTESRVFRALKAAKDFAQ